MKRADGAHRVMRLWTGMRLMGMEWAGTDEMGVSLTGTARTGTDSKGMHKAGQGCERRSGTGDCAES